MIHSEAGRVPGRATRFAALDGWRGVCALLVALHHLSADTSVFALSVVREGWLCVDFFFVLSGFVICHAYGTRIREPQDVAGFVVRRLGRLWPLHAVVLAALIGIEVVKLAAVHFGHVSFQGAPFAPGSPTSPAAIWSSLALVQSLGLHPDAPWNVPAWSISVEFWTNVVFAVLLLGLRRLGLRALLVAGLAAALLWQLSSMRATFDYGLLRCLYGFFVGVAVHDVWTTLARRRIAIPPFAEVAATVLAIGFVVAPLGEPWRFAAPLVFGLAVLAFAFEAGPVSRLMRARPFQRLGEWSYSVYMVHWLVIGIAGSLIRIAEIALHRGFRVPYANAAAPSLTEIVDFGARWMNDAYMVAYLVAVIALAAFTYRRIEEPARTAFNRLARGLEARRARPTGLARR
jgi:peptidoglycan/LPS O-acetylase OafA/YrhL